MGTNRICEVLEKVKNRFTLLPDCEITVEINPGTVDGNDLCRLRKAGFNRLSIGIQSTDDRALVSLGRIHTAKEGLDCIRQAKNAGFDNISADLMFGLPLGRERDFRQEIQDVMSTQIVHLSAYSLQLEEGTPLYLDRDELVFPSEEQEEDEYQMLCKEARANGFLHYEISSFAKPGFESKHNGGYWDIREYFGFGAGAHSFFGGKRFSAVLDINKFISCPHSTAFDSTDFLTAPLLSVEELEEERVMLGLRTSKGAQLSQTQAEIAKRIQELGLGVLHGNRFVLNESGFRVSNQIIGMILK